MGTRRLQIIIDTEYKGQGLDQAVRGFNNLPQSANKAKQGMLEFSGGIQVVDELLNKFVGAGALLRLGNQMIAFGQQSLGVASNVDEQMSKFTTVFGQYTDSAMADLTAFADATGRSSNEFIGFAATLQDTFVPLGFARKEAADMSTQLVKLAVDLSSFNNLSVEEVVGSLQSALVGNTESVRKFGVVLNEATIKQEAFSLGMYKGTGNVSPLAKAQASLNLIIKGTADAQGDAVRTGQGYENQTRSLSSATIDLQVAVGHLLQPLSLLWINLQTQGVNALTSSAEAMANMGDTVDKLVNQNEQLAKSTDSPIEATKKLTDGLQVINDETNKLWTTQGLLEQVLQLTTVGMLKASGAEGEMRTSLLDLTKASIDHIDTNAKMSERTSTVTQSLQKVYGSAYELKGGMIYLNGVMVTNIETMRIMAETYQKKIPMTTGWGIAQTIATDALIGLRKEVVIGTEEIQRLSAAQGEAEDKRIQSNNQLSDEESTIREANAANAEYFSTLAKNKAVMDQYTENQKQAMAETHRLAEEMRKAAEVASGDYFTSAMKASSGQGFFNQSLASLGERYVRVGGLNEQQASDLEKLQSQYDSASQTIHDYEVGIKGLELSEDERNSKIQEQIEQMQLLQGVISPLASVTGELQRVNVEATINQEAVNSALYEAADAAGASSVELALLGGALGLYSDEAIEAALQSALIQAEITKLATAYANGEISVSDMKEQLNEFIAEVSVASEKALEQAEIQDRVATTGNIAAEGMSNLALSTKEASDSAVTGVTETESLIDSATRLEGKAKDAASAARDLAISISELQDKTVTVSVNYMNNIPGGGVDQYKGAQTGNEAKFALGGEVWGGKAGLDSVPALLMPGERVLTVAENKAYKQGTLGNSNNAGRGDNYYISTSDPMPAVLEQIAQRQKIKYLEMSMGS